MISYGFRRKNLTYDIGYDIIFFVVEVWLSLVEHYVRDVGAAGSNPVTSTIPSVLTGSEKVM